MLDQAEICLTLVPAEADGDRAGEDCQRELRHCYEQLRASGMKVSPRIYTKDSAGAVGSLVGEFVIPLATTIGPVLAAAVSAWFQRRDGRKLRLKVGDIEVEAHSEEELERLLEQAIEVREREYKPAHDHE